MGESKFEQDLIDEIMEMYPGAIILKNDSSLLQGIPDRLVLFEDRWAAFETKAYGTARHRPNQDYYIRVMNNMSFAQFVFPENKERFLYGLQSTFRVNRATRLPRW